ncbi:MAG: aldo/keto reductase [Rhodobacterales bacterium]|jgi:predicted oxidoreductase|tara:strand:+ start:1092 stop:1976 length:885 start_codon:yes stop_codon:yes gene_type:complete
MERISLTNNVTLSRLIYGMWRLSDDTDTSASHVQAKIEACLAQGITTMDQADIYGGYEAEEVLGHALRAAPQLRDQIEIVTKCDILVGAGRYASTRVKHYDTSAAHIAASVDHSLQLMATDYIDLLLIHRPDPLMDHRETGAALDAAVASGKVGSVGVSNFKPHDWNLLQSAMQTPLVTNQIEISVLETSAFTNGDLAFLQERDVPAMAWSPLAGGALFSGDNPKLLALLGTIGDGDSAAAAVAWLLAHPARILPVLGTNNLSRIQALDAACGIAMDRETWFEIYEAANGCEVA